MKLSNKLVGDVACSGNSVEEHQPRLLRVPGSNPGWGVCEFFLFLPDHFSFFFVLSFPSLFPSTL